MVRVLDVEMMGEIVHRHGIGQFLSDIITQMKKDFSNWHEFDKIPRPAFHVTDGVIELMPVANKQQFAYKCVNGHPKNPENGKQTVVATGQLLNNHDGYPVLLSEMTLLTGLRTAAVSALASDMMSRKDSKVLAIIGTGAQSEFQAIAHKEIRNIEEIRFFDTDSEAMDKFYRNMGHNFSGRMVKLTPCTSVENAIENADIIIVCTACKAHADVIQDSWVVAGQHINGLGGDCPGKTEIESSLLERSRVIVEYFEQSFIEGEIQRFDRTKALEIVDAHLYEVIKGEKVGRNNDSEITVFDGVGIGMEDFSALSVVSALANTYDIGHTLEMVPDIKDPKDLFGALLK